MTKSYPGKILLVVANKARDQQGHALVGYHLEKQFGDEVVFTTGKQLEEKLAQVRPKVLVLDQLAWDYRVRAALIAKQLGAKLVLLPTSGLFQADDRHRHLQLAGVLFGANKLVNKFLAWGGGTRRYLIQEGAFVEAQVTTVGCPRFDFYAEPLLALAGSRDQLLASLGIKRHNNPLIVWTPNNTSYAKDTADFMQSWAKGTRIEPTDIQGEMRDIETQYQEHSRIIVQLAQSRPEWQFVVKVHPSDKPDRFLWMQHQAGNIAITWNVATISLLYHADILVQRYSTTANEAWILRKPVVLLDIGKFNIGLDKEFMDGCDAARNLTEAHDFIAARSGGAPIPEEQSQARNRFIQENFFRVDGRSAERAAWAIHGQLEEKSNNSERALAQFEPMVSIAPKPRSFPTQLRQIARRMLGRGRSATSSAKSDAVLRIEVDAIYRRLGDCKVLCQPVGRVSSESAAHDPSTFIHAA